MSSLILVTGPRHSGKTLCSRALGKIMGWEVVDLDELVEKQTGKTARTLFNEGQEIFRKAEALALASVFRTRSKDGSLIAAAGGGLIDNPEALSLLSEPLLTSRFRKVIPVYLDVSPETAWRRILDAAAGGELPPFLNTENPRETHLALHRRRSESYRAMAFLTVYAENKTTDEIAGEIADYLKESK